MNKKVLKNESLVFASRLVRGSDLDELMTRCENQKTMTTTAIKAELLEVHEAMKVYAIQIRKLVDEI